MADLGSALVRQLEHILRDSEELLEFRRIVDSPNELSAGQWLQLYGFTLDFAPDLIVELGRGYGNSTALFTHAANHLGRTRVVSIGFDAERGWETRTAPGLADRVPARWFDRLEVIHGDILEVDFARVFGDDNRIMLFWDAHGGDVAQFLLARVLPLLATREHVVAVHGIDDARFENGERAYVRADGARTYWHGYLTCAFEELTALHDFASRNDVRYATARESLHRLAETDPEGWAGLESSLRDVRAAGVLHEGHWLYFSLADGAERLVFPTFEARGQASDEGAALPYVEPGNHPVFAQFRRWNGWIDGGWDVNWLGVRTRAEYYTIQEIPTERRYVATPPLPFDDEYFEWIDLLETVVAARTSYTMIELGAGYGRWIVNAAAAIRQYSGLPYFLVGVEAEPTHFAWMQQHVRDNDVDAGSLRLVEAAVAATDGYALFQVGNADSYYGQELVAAMRRRVPLPTRLLSFIARQRGFPDVATVPAVSVTTLLADLERVDLVHADIQAAEADVFEAAADAVDAKVKRVHVSTHGAANEERLRALFRRLEWQNLIDYAAHTAADTAYGRIDFEDGVQSWLNPRL